MATSVGFQLEGGRIPGERIETTIETSDSATFTTTETTVTSVTAELVAGRTYRVRSTAGWVSDNAGDEISTRIREDSVSGSILILRVVDMFRTGSFTHAPPLEAEFTASSTGSKTFVLTGERLTGSGNCVLDAASSNPTYFYVDYIRG